LMRPPTSDGWGAVLAWHTLGHLAGSELPSAIAALARPLRAGGWLVLALRIGDGVRARTEWLGQEVDLEFVLHDPAEVLAAVAGAGLGELEWYRRGPLATREETDECLYVLARRP
ncbi:MAG: DUF480 domain-containing protein, partial [Actinomycetia bacterium]|nr:DUF480 domain-containing protein [Actinomycetes bacterium]